MFPWLSQIAPQYESYKFKKLRFRYQGTTSTGASGSVYLAVEYDASDPSPTSKTQIANWQETKFCSPWEVMTHVSTQNNLNKRSSYYVRNGTLPANSDIKLYDVGYLCVVQSNVMPAANTSASVGEVWVDYEVELRTPQLNAPGLNNALYAKITLASSAAQPVIAGNLPLIAVEAGGILTVTIPRPYTGLVTAVGIIAAPFTTTGLTQLASSSDPDTFTTAIFSYNGDAGGSFTINMTTGAPTNVTLRIAQYDVSLA